jgi:TP901 family phage tail tape measure protein
MDKNVRIAVILSAVDRMSGIIAGSVSKSQAKLQALSAKSYAFGTASVAASAGIAAMLYKPVTAFAELEDASLGLKSKLMQDGGILPIKQFEKLTALSVELGNRLPGTTSDFTKMFTAMKSNGADVNTMLNGAGTAAAYYAMATKQGYEQAGIAATRLQQQMGIANKDMVASMDLMSRIADTGIDPTEMEYFFAKSSAAMKMFNQQGLGSFKTLGIIGSMLVKQFKSGETAGTGLTKIMNELANPKKLKAFNDATRAIGINMQFFDKKGKFISLENMYIQFAKLSRLNPSQLNKVLLPLTGGDGADNSMIGFMAKSNIQGFNQQSDALAKQAKLVDKINILLDSLSAKWEAGLGNLTNALAAFGATFAPILKGFADWVGTASTAMQGWIKQHPTLSKYIGILMIGLTAALSVIGGLGFVIGGVISGYANWLIVTSKLGNALFWLEAKIAPFTYGIYRSLMPALSSAIATTWAWTAALLANPITWIVAGVIALGAAAYLIYKNWDPITKWFSNQWTMIKAQVSGSIAVFNLLSDVVVGLGKSFIGAFTFNPKMFAEGALQAKKAVDSIMNGGISNAYNGAYNKVMNANTAAKIAAAPLSRTSPLGKPLMQPNFLKPLGEPVRRTAPVTNNHFAPVINLQGSASTEDGKKLADTLKPHWEKWQRDNNRNQRMTKY